MSYLQSKDKEMKWIDVQDQLPRDGEDVWTCILPFGTLVQRELPYLQTLARFYRASGWIFHGIHGDVHYWHPKPLSPPKPKWYIESLNDG